MPSSSGAASNASARSPRTSRIKTCSKRPRSSNRVRASRRSTTSATTTARNAVFYEGCNFDYSSWLVASRGIVWLLSSEGDIQAARVRVGEGAVTVVNAVPFVYRELFDGDHGELLVAAADCASAITSSSCRKPTSSSLPELVWRYGAPVVVVLLLFIALALVARRRCVSARSWRPPNACAARSPSRFSARGASRFASAAARRSSPLRSARCTRRPRGASSGYERLPRAEQVAAVARLAAVDGGRARCRAWNPQRSALDGAARQARCCSNRRVVNSSQGANGRSMENESDLSSRAAELLERLRDAIGQAMVGQTAVIEQVVAALAASGHVLIEGVPGLGKTLLVRALAKALSLAHGRVQFTPDMMPSDITGHAVLDPEHARAADRARAGVHARAARRRDQSRAGEDAERAARGHAGVSGDARGSDVAAAEAVHGARDAKPRRNRGHVSAAGSAARPVPVQDRDRLPDARRGGRRRRARDDGSSGRRAAARRRAAGPRRASRRRVCSAWSRSSASTSRSSTTRCASCARRASGRALRSAPARAARSRSCAAARAVALLAGRNFVTPDDVKSIALPALRHRVALAPDASLEGRTPNDLLAAVIDSVPAPRDVADMRVAPSRKLLCLLAGIGVAALAALLAGVALLLVGVPRTRRSAVLCCCSRPMPTTLVAPALARSERTVRAAVAARVCDRCRTHRARRRSSTTERDDWACDALRPRRCERRRDRACRSRSC